MNPIHIYRLLCIFALITCAFYSHAKNKKHDDGWYPFDIQNNQIVINILFNNRPAKALIDSGSEINLVNKKFIQKYAPNAYKSGTIILQGVNSQEKVKMYSNVPIQLFGLDINLKKAPAVMLPDDVALIIGAPLFMRRIVQLDYPNKRMRLLPSRSVDMVKASNLKIKRQKGSVLPAVRVLIKNKPVWLTLDTGNSTGLLVKRRIAVNNDWLEDDKTNSKNAAIVGLNKSISANHIYLDEVKIGPYTLDHVSTIIPAKGENSKFSRRESELRTGSRFSYSKQVTGILGYDVLKHFVLTLDYDSYLANIYAP